MTYRIKGKLKVSVYAKKANQGSRSIPPFISLGARRKSVVNITTPAALTPGKNPRTH
jgi:hypothetical protein